MNDNVTLIKAELEKAGEDPKTLRLLQELEGCSITPESEIPPMEFLFQMMCQPCFPRGELVAVSGKAKSGKTLITSVVMSLTQREELLTIKRLSPEPLSVLWYDTEQSEESTQDILKNRIMPLINEGKEEPMPFPEDRFHVFNVRCKQWQMRMPLLEAAIRKYSPDLVIVDGIRDLIDDINDGTLAQDVIERLMNLASELNCCIVCVLHQNKGLEDKNLRGWIGTELKNKAFEVYECTKDNDRIFSFKQTDTRKYDIVDSLKYIVDEKGLPRVSSIEEMKEAAAMVLTQYRRPMFEPKYVKERNENGVVFDIPQLFSDAFGPGETLDGIKLQERVMELAHITSSKFYCARHLEALRMGVIKYTTGPDGRRMYTCNVGKKSEGTGSKAPDSKQKDSPPDLFSSGDEDKNADNGNDCDLIPF